MCVAFFVRDITALDIKVDIEQNIQNIQASFACSGLCEGDPDKKAINPVLWK